VASLYAQAGAFEKSLATYDGWIAANPKSDGLAEALSDRCRARTLQGRDLDKALADCDAALKRGQHLAPMLDNRALVELKLGRYDAAIADYNEALKLQPRLGRALYGRGIAEKARGMESQGQADISAAIEINRTLPQLFRRLGLETGAQASGGGAPAPAKVQPQ
jgi:tetratricopeptide (TPR) repeat protein